MISGDSNTIIPFPLLISSAVSKLSKLSQVPLKTPHPITVREPEEKRFATGTKVTHTRFPPARSLPPITLPHCSQLLQSPTNIKLLLLLHPCQS